MDFLVRKCDTPHSKNAILCRLATADSGIFLVMTSDSDASTNWVKLADAGRALAAKGELPGFDPTTMEIQPMRANPAWGPDMGPHFSIVSVVGMGTVPAPWILKVHTTPSS